MLHKPLSGAGRELSERELVALDAARGAVEGAAKCPVLPTFVRKFRAGRITKKGNLEVCCVRLMFGFRRRDINACGVGEATVSLQHSPVFYGTTDGSLLYVWTPYDVKVTVRGDVPFKPGVNYASLRIGDFDWRASYRVYARQRA